jgi:FkbM family methyltransferase
MFAFYRRNRERYRTAADIGANLGLHSIVMSKCGYKVEAYEPDPAHHASLMRNLDLNDVRSCQVFESAVSDRKGSTEFVRVLGNTTSSHLAGAKPNPYGELERFTVSLCDVREIADRVDLMKIDAEGHEAVLLNAIADDQWQRVDAFVEVGSAQNAEAVFNRFRGTPINVFAQSGGWSRVNTLDDMPTSYKQGGIFVTAKSAMPW